MKIRLISCLALLFALHPLAVTTASAANNGIVVVVNGRPILKSEVDDRMKEVQFAIMRQATSQEQMKAEIEKVRAKVVDSLIDQELVLNEFQPFAATAARV